MREKIGKNCENSIEVDIDYEGLFPLSCIVISCKIPKILNET